MAVTGSMPRPRLERLRVLRRCLGGRVKPRIEPLAHDRPRSRPHLLEPVPVVVTISKDEMAGFDRSSSKYSFPYSLRHHMWTLQLPEESSGHVHGTIDGAPAMIENPGDDSLRHIVADWLDDHGEQKRAEFICVQCARARLFRLEFSLCLRAASGQESKPLGRNRCSEGVALDESLGQTYTAPAAAMPIQKFDILGV